MGTLAIVDLNDLDALLFTAVNDMPLGVGEIGFDWVCFFGPEGGFISIIL